MKTAETDTPKSLSYRLQAEWEPQKAVWLAWPCHEDLWQENFEGAKLAVTELAKAIHEGGAAIHLLVLNKQKKQEAQKIFEECNITPHFYMTHFGDIWLRDTAPLFLTKAGGTKLAVSFSFNGWGGKYLLSGDQDLAKRIAKQSGYATIEANFVLEGGAIEVDGLGTGITTEQCLLNPNRNPSLQRKQLEELLHDYLRIEHLIWLDQGLKNDHTDGHIDNLARFVAPGTVLCMEALRRDDPNRDIFLSVQKRLKKARDAQGKRLEIITIPSPGPILDDHKNPMPASYLNFLITNEVVAVPLFRSSMDEQAYYRFTHLFPGKKIIGIDCLDLLTGGGALHCISQPEPK